VFAFYTFRHSHERRLKRLLTRVNFQEVLTACRELSSRAEEGTLSTGTYWVRLDRQPQLAEVPACILKVNPIYVRIAKEGYVELEMGGIPFWGFVAYATDRREDYPFQGDAEIVPGLWYYSEDYAVYPRIREQIDSVIQEAKQPLNK